jgi:hypothetical protein
VGDHVGIPGVVLLQFSIEIFNVSTKPVEVEGPDRRPGLPLGEDISHTEFQCDATSIALRTLSLLTELVSS